MSTSLAASRAKNQRLRKNLFCYLQPTSQLYYNLFHLNSLYRMRTRERSAGSSPQDCPGSGRRIVAYVLLMSVNDGM